MREPFLTALPTRRPGLPATSPAPRGAPARRWLALALLAACRTPPLPASVDGGGLALGPPDLAAPRVDAASPRAVCPGELPAPGATCGGEEGRACFFDNPRPSAVCTCFAGNWDCRPTTSQPIAGRDCPARPPTVAERCARPFACDYCLGGTERVRCLCLLGEPVDCRRAFPGCGG